MSALPRVAVLGSGGHARVVADILRAAGREVEGWLDPHARAGEIRSGLPVLGGDERLDDPAFAAGREFVVGVADQATRRRLSGLLASRGGRLTCAVHPRAVVSPAARLGSGVVLAAGSVVQPGAVLGDSVILHPGATVDHDDVLEEGVQIGPGAHLAGFVTCREDVFVGTGAAVIPGCTLGARSIVGAGAVVIADLPADVTAVGCPARILGRRGG